MQQEHGVKKFCFLARGTLKSHNVKDIAKYGINSQTNLSVEARFRIYFSYFRHLYHLHAHIYPADYNEQMDNRTFQVILQKPYVILSVHCPNIPAACLKNLIFTFSFTLSDHKCDFSPLNIFTSQHIAFCQYHNLMSKALYGRLDGPKGCSECGNWDIIYSPDL